MLLEEVETATSLREELQEASWQTLAVIQAASQRDPKTTAPTIVAAPSDHGDLQQIPAAKSPGSSMAELHLAEEAVERLPHRLSADGPAAEMDDGAASIQPATVSAADIHTAVPWEDGFRSYRPSLEVWLPAEILQMILILNIFRQIACSGGPKFLV